VAEAALAWRFYELSSSWSFWRRLGRGGGLSPKASARQIFHASLHFVFVVRIGPDVVPHMQGPILRVGDGYFLMHSGGRPMRLGSTGAPKPADLPRKRCGRSESVTVATSDT